MAPARRDVPGLRGDLTLGRIYVADFFAAGDEKPADVVVWFMGADWCVEQTFYDAKQNSVLITATAKDLWETFRQADALENLLSEAEAWLSSRGISDKPIDRVCLGSFSGGYVAIREILKQDHGRRMITSVVLADSLYAPRIEGSECELDPDAMAPFLDYAERATAGDCVFVFSHLYPPKPEHRENTTTLAAEYLTNHLQVKREDASGINCRGARLAYRADRNGFHVFGYYGMTTQDHFEHFYAASDLLRMISSENVAN